MEFRITGLFGFFGILLLIAFLVLPREFDMVAMYRNSYLYNQALELLDRLETQRPDDTRIDLERARVLFLAGRYDEGISLMERVTQRDSNNTEAWRQLASLYRVTQQPRKAMFAYENLIVYAPADSQALYMLDEYYRWFQVPDKSIATLEAMTRHYNQERYTFEKLFDIYMRTENINGGIQTLQRMIDQFPDNINERLELAQLYLVQGNERAIPLFQDLHTEFPNNENIAQDLIEALRVKKRTAEAVTHFESFYRPRLDDETYYDRLTDLYISLDQPTLAAQSLAQKLALYPSAETQYAVALLYIDATQYAQALTHTHILTQTHPEEPVYWETHIDVLGALEQKENLVVALEAYISRWPNNWEKYQELADAYNWVQNPRKELEMLIVLQKKYPNRTDYLQRIAEAHLALGNSEKAAEQAAQLVRLYPTQQTYRDLLLYALHQMPQNSQRLAYAQLLSTKGITLTPNVALTLAEFYETAKQTDKADNIYAQLIKQHPKDVPLRVRIGQLTWYNNRLAIARSHFRHALTMAPNDTLALIGLADILRADTPQEALTLLKQLDRITPNRPETIYRLASVYETLSDTLQAKSHYRKYLTHIENTDTNDVTFLRQKAHALYRTNNDTQALVVLDKARQKFPNNLELVNDYAEVLIFQKRYEQALTLLNQIEAMKQKAGTGR